MKDSGAARFFINPTLPSRTEKLPRCADGTGGSNLRAGRRLSLYRACPYWDVGSFLGLDTGHEYV